MSDSLAFAFMGWVMKNAIRAVLIMIFMIGVFAKVSKAVVPSSTSLRNEFQVQADHQRLTDILDKLERHEEENIRFLKNIKNEMRDLK